MDVMKNRFDLADQINFEKIEVGILDGIVGHTTAA